MAGNQHTTAPMLGIWAPRVLTTAAVILLPWMALLTVRLHGDATRRSLGSSWVGLDIVELIELIVLAAMMRRRHQATSPFAAAAATTMIADAWFDVMSSDPRLDYVQSILLAGLVELPLAALLIWVAWHTLGWTAPTDAHSGSNRDTRRSGYVK